MHISHVCEYKYTEREVGEREKERQRERERLTRQARDLGLQKEPKAAC